MALTSINSVKQEKRVQLIGLWVTYFHFCRCYILLADMSLVQKNLSHVRKQTSKAAKRPEWDVRFSYTSLCVYIYLRQYIDFAYTIKLNFQ